MVATIRAGEGAVGKRYDDGPLIMLVEFGSTAQYVRPSSAGRDRRACRCGLSAIKPFCDGSIRGSSSVLRR